MFKFMLISQTCKVNRIYTHDKTAGGLKFRQVLKAKSKEKHSKGQRVIFTIILQITVASKSPALRLHARAIIHGLVRDE